MRSIAAQKSDWFYRGPFAQAVEQWMKSNGGIMTAEDFRNYRIKLREPILSDYRGYTIVGFPPPSSGGVHVAQMLNILENYNLKALGETERAGFDITSFARRCCSSAEPRPSSTICAACSSETRAAAEAAPR